MGNVSTTKPIFPESIETMKTDGGKLQILLYQTHSISAKYLEKCNNLHYRISTGSIKEPELQLSTIPTGTRGKGLSTQILSFICDFF